MSMGDPGSGAVLLNELAAFVRRFVVMSDAQVVAVALFVFHSHAIDAAEATPYLNVKSPTKRAGKTRLQEVLELLVCKPQPAANMSEAALFRVIEQRCPTLLLDEVDAVFKKGSDKEDLRALLNAGYRRGVPVLRVVGEGKKMEVKEFQVFGPKVLTGIGDLPDTLADRSLPIKLKRKRSDESCERFLRREAEVVAAPLRERIRLWCEAELDALTEARPELPAALDDRAQDSYEPLLAIADHAGGDWPQKARAALVELRNGDQVQDESLAVRLLADVRRVFEEQEADRLGTAELIDGLASDLEAPWADWRGGTITPRSLARLLAPFGIKSRVIRVSDSTPRGFLREQFEDAWSRYPLFPTSENATVQQTAWLSEKEPISMRNTSPLMNKGMLRMLRIEAGGWGDEPPSCPSPAIPTSSPTPALGTAPAM